MVKHFPINGVPTKKAYPRLPVNDFATDSKYSKQWNLFLQALTELHKQGEDVNSPLGFYQIAGIHGVPFVQWMEEKDPEDRPGNYCTHGTAIFLTWHRPYLLLLEQRIVEEALNIASGFSEKYKKTYQDEAVKIRLPYWDWATDTRLPGPTRNPKTKITLPKPGSDNVTTVEANNPLYSYKFHDRDRRIRDMSILRVPEFIGFNETKRCPDKDGNSRPEVADKQLAGPGDPAGGDPTNFRDGIFKLLVAVERYGPFSNTGSNPNPDVPPEFIPLESYHNTVHDYVGTDFSSANLPHGHMTHVPVSGFDPIFWLHHANIDRIYAMWQAIRFESEFENQPTPNTRLPFTSWTDTAETTLRPFYLEEDGNPWTSAMVQKFGQEYGPTTFKYGYTYPEVPSEGKTDIEREIIAIQTLFTAWELYGPRRFPGFLEAPEKLPVDLKLPSNTQYRREWMIFLRVKKYLVDGNFIILFFFGDVPKNPEDWVGSKNRIGSFNTFKSETDYCANCSDQNEADVIMTGGVDITTRLYNALKGTDINLRDQDEVEKWLAKNLDWRILLENRTELKLEDTKSRDGTKNLIVGVKSFEMAYPPTYENVDAPDTDTRKSFGAIFDPVTHHKATEGNALKGGLRKGETHLAVGTQRPL